MAAQTLGSWSSTSARLRDRHSCRVADRLRPQETSPATRTRAALSLESRFHGERAWLRAASSAARVGSRRGRASRSAAIPATAGPNPAGRGHGPLSDPTLLDDLSIWIWSKIKPKCCGVEGGGMDYLSALPDGLHRKLHGFEPWAVALVRESIILLVAYLVMKNSESFCRGANWLWAKAVMRDPEITEEEYQASGFSALVGPIQFFTAVLLGTRFIREAFLMGRFPLSPGLIGRLRIMSIVMAGTWFLMGWKSRVMGDLRTHDKISRPQLAVLDRVVSLLLITIGMLTGAEFLGIPLRSITAVGGISGIAIGLASKEVVTNFFGGLVVYITRPFVVGEAIKAGQFSGIVQDIGFFQTKLIGFDKHHITVPNQVFTNMVITNMSRSKHRVFDASFEIRNQDILTVDRVTQRIADLLRKHPAIDLTAGRPTAYLKACGPMGLTIALSGTARSMSGGDFYAAQQEILTKSAKIIAEEGAAFGHNSPYPPPSTVKPSNGAVSAEEAPKVAATAMS